MKKKGKRNRKNHSSCLWLSKEVPVFVSCLAIILFIVLLSIVIIFSFSAEPSGIYVFPENPKQGDTVFIRVKGEFGGVTGKFGDENIVFYRKGNLPEWISLLGIDADQNPGEYKISVNTSREPFGALQGEPLTKEIKVVSADFLSQPAFEAPVTSQNGTTQAKAVSNIVNSDNPVLKKAIGNPTPNPYFTGHFSFPLSTMKITGLSFGNFIEFASQKFQHFGVDLKAPVKTEIYAINDGKVVATLDLSNYGRTVIIDHGLDIFSLYLHLDEFKVSEGNMVHRGQMIGLSGDTGYVTAPHLHFSVRVSDSRVDPIAFIEATKRIDDNFILADITNAFLNIFNKK